MIRKLRAEDAEAYVELRRQALQDAPGAFAASAEDDLVATAEAVREQLRRAPESVLIGAFRERLVGMVGLYRERHVKSAPQAHLWGMYVAPAVRGQGIGSLLLAAALDHARTLPGVSWVHLSVSSAAPAAQRLYERAGFRVWGSEPDALRHGGETLVEHHMALPLRG
jgi:ribosomal protein S18 acetylase RimI-like enzyme